MCYDIEYDHENGKVYLNATLYLDDEDNCLFDKVEGIACWNENINDIDIVFETEDGIVLFASDRKEIIAKQMAPDFYKNTCQWFDEIYFYVKKILNQKKQSGTNRNLL